MAQSTAAVKKRKGILGGLALLAMIAGLCWSLFIAPPDAYQGEVQRIMYLHLPSILIAYLSYFLVFIGSGMYLWKREKKDDLLAHAAAELGVLFTALTIIEGSIWGKPTWGVWWTWDARLTLTAILLLIYAGYLMLRSLIDDEQRAASVSTIEVLAGPGTPTRTFSFDGMSKINGKVFSMKRIDFQVPFGTVERWRFTSKGNAPHPVHVHGASFQVKSRSGGRGTLFPWEQGWKDTVLLQDFETVDVLIRFDGYRGIYLMHCHKLEHEDMGMMLNFEVI